MIKISSMAFAIVIGMGVFFGLYYFAYDLAYYSDGTQKYDINLPDSGAGNMTALWATMENTTTTLQDTLSGSETSWTTTAYNIFFSVPSNVLRILVTTADAGGKMIGILTGPESPLPIPSWVIIMLGVIITLIVGFTFVKFVFGSDG
jgi:hypothetical protein